MKSSATTVGAYLAELPDDRRHALETIRAMIKEAAPDAEEGMQYGMAGYSMGEILFGLGSQKVHMALYVCDVDAVEANRDRLGKLNCGKGCIRFRKLADLPLDVVADVLRAAAGNRRAGKAVG